MTFGERLRYLREEKELRQKDVANILNTSARMYGYYETDKHFPGDANMILALAEYFNVSLDYLFGVNNIKNSKTLNEFEFLFSELSEENKKTVVDFMNFLLRNQK